MAYRQGSQTFTQAFQGKRAKLIEAMFVTHRLLNYLQDKKLLTGQHVIQIMACNSGDDNRAVDNLLRILERRDNTLFPAFLDALVADEQEHIVRDFFTESAPRFVHIGIQVSIGDGRCHSLQACENMPKNAASQTDGSLIDLLNLSRSELRHLFFSNQHPVDVGVQTVKRNSSRNAKRDRYTTSAPNTTKCAQHPTNVAHVTTQAEIEQKSVTTQTDGSYTDYCALSAEVHLIQRRDDDEEFDYGMCNLPIEILEFVLMRTFAIKFTDHCKSHYRTRDAVQSAYNELAAVCYSWWRTMNGWPQSTTRHWFMHKTRQIVRYLTLPYWPWPYRQSSLRTVSLVCGIAQCDNKLFVACHESDSIRVFGPNNEQLPIVKVKEMKEPNDIVACSETRQLYIAGESRDSRCVWRVSGDEVVKWLPNNTSTTSQFRPGSLSITSRRLLVTSKYDELLLYGSDGTELKRVSLPAMELLHAMETNRGTFVVSHWQPQPQVSEVDVDGHIIRAYSSQLELSRPDYLSLDSDGRVFVTDTYNDRILLLNSCLEVERILLDAEHDTLVRYPRRLHYVEQTGQLVVGSSDNYFQIFQVRDRKT